MYRPNLETSLLSSKTVRTIVAVVDELRKAIPNTKENYELKEKADYIIHKTEKTLRNRQGKRHENNKSISNGEKK